MKFTHLRKQKRLWLVVSTVVAVAAIVVLASGLSTVDLTYEGRQLPRLPRGEEEADASGAPSTPVLDVVFRVLFMVGGALLPFAIILYIVSPGARKQLLRDLIAVLIVLTPLYLLSRLAPGTSESLGDIQLPQAGTEGAPPVPDVAYSPEPRQWLTLVLTVGIALVLAAIVVGVAWALWRRRKRSPSSAERLAQEAQNAIDAIESGADLRNTVTRCYLEMMQVLKEERGVQRERAMTPREFERELERRRVPTTQVRRLTRLFEAVRYGDKQLSEREERQAVVSLTAIVRYCRGDA